MRRRIRQLVLAGAAVAITCVGLTVVLRGGDPSPEVQVAHAATFAQAIEMARPAFVDTTEELGAGARLLAHYATAKLRWSEVDVPAETTIRQPDRGKRLCATGEIRQITRRELNGRTVHVGRLRTADADEVAFVAVGTTGDLVERSAGRLCGAVLGKSGSAVSILGMFDLAENRMPLVEHE
ncbi:hypothetical protein BH11MYX3_BH11MYX3_31160 [soil metagenome]